MGYKGKFLNEPTAISSSRADQEQTNRFYLPASTTHFSLSPSLSLSLNLSLFSTSRLSHTVQPLPLNHPTIPASLPMNPSRQSLPLLLFSYPTESATLFGFVSRLLIKNPGSVAMEKDTELVAVKALGVGMEESRRACEMAWETMAVGCCAFIPPLYVLLICDILDLWWIRILLRC